MKFIVREPFPGHAESVLNEDGTVAYTDGLTLEQYKEREKDKNLRVVSEIKMLELVRKYTNKMITKPKRINRQRFWDALECLPPSKYHRVNDFLVFHIVERITYDMVDWFAQSGEDKFYSWVDRSDITDEQIADKLGKLK